MTSGYSLAERKSLCICLMNSSATKASFNPGNKFSYSVGSARDSAAFWLTLQRFSLHCFTTLLTEQMVTVSCSILKGKLFFKHTFLCYLETWLGKYVRAKKAASGKRPVLIKSSRQLSSLKDKNGSGSHIFPGIISISKHRKAFLFLIKRFLLWRLLQFLFSFVTTQN